MTRPVVPHERNLYWSRVLAWTKKHPEKLAKVKVPPEEIELQECAE